MKAAEIEEYSKANKGAGNQLEDNSVSWERHRDNLNHSLLIILQYYTSSSLVLPRPVAINQLPT